MNAVAAFEVPPQFRDLNAFRNWVDDSFPEDATTTDKGATWLDYTMGIVPLTGFGKRFGSLTRSERHSGDDGVDADSAPTAEGHVLAVQARLTVPGKEQLDGVISKFHHYEQQLGADDEGRLWSEDDAAPIPFFALVCANPMNGILAAYLKSNLSSRPYFDSLREQGRIEIVGGERLIDEMTHLWTEHFGTPTSLSLSSPQGWLESSGVWIGLVPGSQLAALESEHGLGLFYENVRSFLGLKSNSDRLTVNEAIVETASRRPDKMLARNNGVVFRASSVEPDGSGGLLLSDASIVNGCQTTMCLASLGEGLGPECEVLVKVVEATDAWEVAEAANNQNAVNQIDLKLARYLRKQVAEKAAAEAGIGLRNHTSPEGIVQVIASVRNKEANYDQLRYLFLGLFSSKPNHLWDDNYNRLRTDVLDQLYGESSDAPQELFQTLFMVLEASNEGLRRSADIENDPLQRVHDDSKPKYRIYFGILALCATLEDNLAERCDKAETEAARMARFLEETRAVLEDSDRRREYIKNFVRAYSVVSENVLDLHDDDAKGRVAQHAINRVKDASFTSYYERVINRIRSDQRVQQLN